MNTAKRRIVAFAFAAALMARGAGAQTVEDFFDDTVLHEVRIEIKASDWQSLKTNFLDKTPYNASFQWRDIILDDIALHSRGTGSASPVKPSLKLDFNYNIDDQRFLGLKGVILRANTQDASMLRERLSMIVFRRLGVLASREASTKLFVNGDYVGLYTIVESIDKTFLKTNLNENDGYLYKYDYDPGDPAWYFEYKGSDPNLYIRPLGPFQPETHENKTDAKPIEAMVRTINQSSDADFERLMAEYLDLRLWLKHVAIERFLGEQDGVIGYAGMNNFYFYRFEKKNLSQMIAWDKSNTFASPTESIWRYVNDVSAGEQNRLLQRLLKIPALRNVYLESLAAAARLAGEADGLLAREVKRQYDQTRQAALEDKYKQKQGPTGALVAASNEDFEASIAHLQNFAAERSASVLEQVAGELTPVSERAYSIADRGAGSVSTVGDSAATVTGYARIDPASGATVPAGVAIFSYRPSGVVVTEAGVPASALAQSGRIYAEIGGAVDTGIAIANPGAQTANVSFHFTDASGTDFGHGTTTIAAGQQIAEFLDQSRFKGGSRVEGTFTFTSDVPVAAVALRSFNNERFETLITTLPVTAPGTEEDATVFFPHFADGAGWTTQVVLVNPTDAELRGTVDFYDPGSAAAPGAPATVTIDGQTASSFAYTIPPRSARKLRTSGSGGALKSGSVRASAAAGSKSPVGVAIFAYRTGGVTVSEAGVPAFRPATAVRLYAEHTGESIYTGVAVANPASAAITVTAELTDLAGNKTGPTGSFTVPGNGQVALFLDQIPGMEKLETPFQGIVRMTTSASTGISVVGLRGRVNERSDFLITTIPASDETRPAATAGQLFPHIADGGGYTTQFVLYSGAAGQTAAGSLRFGSRAGGELKLRLW